MRTLRSLDPVGPENVVIEQQAHHQLQIKLSISPWRTLLTRQPRSGESNPRFTRGRTTRVTLMPHGLIEAAMLNHCGYSLSGNTSWPYRV